MCDEANSAGLPAPSEIARALSPRLRSVFDQLLTGRSEKQVALALKLRPHTVHTYAKGVYRQFNVNSRAELMSLFVTAPGGSDEVASLPPAGKAGSASRELTVDVVNARLINAETLRAETAWVRHMRRTVKIGAGVAAAVALFVAAVWLAQGDVPQADAVPPGMNEEPPPPQMTPFQFSLTPDHPEEKVCAVRPGQRVHFKLTQGEIDVQVGPMTFPVAAEYHWVAEERGMLKISPSARSAVLPQGVIWYEQ